MSKTLTLACLFFANLLSAQHLRCNIPFQEVSSLGELQCYEVNDSLLILAGAKPKKFTSTWVLPSGETRALNRNQTDLFGKIVLNVTNTRDSVIIYYLDAIQNDLIIRMFTQSKATGDSKIEYRIFPIYGTLIGVYGDKVMNVLSYDEGTHLLRRLKIKGRSLASESKWPVILNMKIDSSATFRFITNERKPISSRMGGTNKIYQVGDTLYFMHDELVKTDQSTTVVKFDLNSGNVSRFTIHETSPDKWSFQTYIVGSDLVRISRQRDTGFMISKFRLQDQAKVNQFEIPEKTPFKDSPSLRHGFVDLTYRYKVFNTIYSPGSPFLNPQGDYSGGTLYKIGTYHTAKLNNRVPIPIITSIPVLAFAGAIARLAMIESTQYQVIDEYFYVWVSWDGSQPVSYCSTICSKEQAIDQYESSLTDHAWSYRRIISAKGKYYGIYQDDGANNLKVVVFDEPMPRQQ